MKTTTAALIIIILILVGALGYILFRPDTEPSEELNVVETPTDTTGTSEEILSDTPSLSDPTVPDESATTGEVQTTIGTSVEGRAITAYSYGTGAKEILFVGGIHGGYAWNTALVAYQLISYIESDPEMIPGDVRVTIIPTLNPDGLYKITGTEGRFTSADVTATQAETIPGRFNANNVDLNRNFDCDWQTTGTWQDQQVSGGASAFSEPESQALKMYVDTHKPVAVVAWYSSAGGVYSSNCHNGILPETRTLTNLYANASGYAPYEEFDFYEITGDMVNWLAKEQIPAISILLNNHTDTDWEENKKGATAVINYYAE